MSGMNAATGRQLSVIDHIKQSIREILTTPIGARIERREFGSLLPELIDQPQSIALTMQLRAAVVMALTQWEPRIRMMSVDFDVIGPGMSVIIEMRQLDTSTEIAAKKIEVGL